MISDKRIEAIESLIASGLNEENIQNPPRASEVYWPLLRTFETVSIDRYRCGHCQSVCSQGWYSIPFIGVVHFETRSPKANFNRLLDVARETFKENVADIYELGRELSEAHGLPLSLVYQDSGFIFQLKKSEVEGELPAEFINATEKKGRIVFSTLDLVRLSFVIRNFQCSSLKKKRNARMKDALDEVMSLSDKLFLPPYNRFRNT